MKKALSVFLSLLFLFSFSSCNDDVHSKLPDFEALRDKMSDTSNPLAVIEMNDLGVIVLELYPGKAPNTVKNFISLAKSGYYDGLTFHRVIPGFMIQGGDPNGNGSGGPGYKIFGEFSNNGFENDVKHVRGTVSMARRGDSYDSAGSQFFIMVNTAAHLDGDYAAFGYCIEGMDVVDKIVAVKTDSRDKPLNDVVIKSVTIEDNGTDYEEPETLL